MQSVQSAANPRRPTVDEAVAFLRAALTERYRRECLQYWREKCGEAFAAKVESLCSR